MTSTQESTTNHVISPDGTRIAVFTSGRGRPLVAVHGTSSDHSTWRLLAPMLEPHMSVHAVDRRGRGGSGDQREHSLAREQADVAAVIDAAAEATGSSVDVIGHSFGGNVAFGAVTLTDNVGRLVLYEGWPPPDLRDRSTPPALMAALESLLARGRREEMLRRFYRDVVMMSEAEVAALEASPTWPARVAAAHTIPRELRSFGLHALDAAEAAAVSVPVLLLVGENSPAEVQASPEAVAAAVPDARIRVLRGQAHVAQLTDPDGLAAEVLCFLRP